MRLSSLIIVVAAASLSPQVALGAAPLFLDTSTQGSMAIEDMPPFYRLRYADVDVAFLASRPQTLRLNLFDDVDVTVTASDITLKNSGAVI